MHILFVTSEIAGVFKLGGLADVSRSLPEALIREGHNVTVLMPFYESVDVTGVTGVGKLAVDFGKKREIVFVFRKKVSAGGAPILLFRHPLLHDYKKDPITGTFAFFSACVSTFYSYGTYLEKNPVDIVHCHDWHTGLVPLLIGEGNKVKGKETLQSKKVKTIFTIHNLLYQGVAEDGILSSLNAPRALFHMVGKGKKQYVSFMREGLEYADVITTVSPTYAREIVAKSRKDAVGNVLVRRRGSVKGILNGIDPAAWKPHYTVKTVLSEKPRLSKTLRENVGLPLADCPVLGFVGRIEPRQKGIELLIEAFTSQLAALPLQFVILGTGEKKTEKKLSELARTHKTRMVFINRFDEDLARQIYEGCDMFLVPSKFEPCGLTQMIAMRYGTVPVVRKTGGLADTVTNGRTGFTFSRYTGSDFADAVVRALRAYGDPVRWKRIVAACMGEDFSWTKSASVYIDLYRRLLRG